MSRKISSLDQEWANTAVRYLGRGEEVAKSTSPLNNFNQTSLCQQRYSSHWTMTYLRLWTGDAGVVSCFGNSLHNSYRQKTNQHQVMIALLTLNAANMWTVVCGVSGWRAKPSRPRSDMTDKPVPRSILALSNRLSQHEDQILHKNTIYSHHWWVALLVYITVSWVTKCRLSYASAWTAPILNSFYLAPWMGWLILHVTTF